MSVSGIQGQAAISMLRNVLNTQSQAAQQLINGLNQASQSVQRDGDGDHGVEPGKGQHINTTA
ncbi:hypothetical protein LLE49_23380 [Alicyclobacillus tolerans]|uniref:hypothetical protein n=1 Tax=Alicyclobacillus tolerans TaxID=90970 RepID=UPI001F1A1E40|nr:hypothetical protein [Alicyclobacillus tolerans]MCF8567666.1 hypothetical protein [Alicyclobacillus tolerans]